MKFGVGQPVRRFEDARLVRGAGRYTDDISIPGQAYAYVVRSPLAHALVRSVKPEVARAMPGVLIVLTGKDVAAEGLGDLPCIFPLSNRDGSQRHDTPRPILATDKTRYAGQPVAVVVAETLSQARDAAESIELDLDELPAIADLTAAMADGRTAALRPYQRQYCLRLGERVQRSGRGRLRVRARGPRHQDRHRQQSDRGERDGAAQRDRRL